jgi:hypothetical protein
MLRVLRTSRGDLTVGGASNLFVDVSTSRVGINEASPQKSLDVNGDARVQSTTDTVVNTAGALVVSGGLGVASNIHSTNVYAGSHVGIGTVATTRPVHVVANSVGGVYVNGAGNDARLGLEATGITADPVVSFNIDGGESFSVGIDNSINDTFNIANHVSDVGTNARMTMTPAGITTITNTTDATSTTDGALIVSGGLGVASSIHAVTVRGATLTGTNLYGTLAGANTAAVTDLTATGTVGGATLTGTNLYGTLTGANTAAVTDLTATGTVGGATLTGTNLYGTLTGANTAAVTDLTATGTVGGVTLTGTNLYGTLTGANTAAVTDLTATGTVGGVTLTGTNLYGTLAGANTAAVTDLTATGTVGGATLTGTNLYGAIAGANTAAVTTLSASGVVNLTDETDATSSITGALKVAGGVGIAKDVYVGEQAYVTGGLVTNMGAVTKKTYSFSNIVTAGGTAPEINVYFTSNVFYSKMTAQLVDDTDEVSTLVLEVAGGGRNGTVPTKNIKVGTKMIFGDATSTPWDSNVLVAPNRIMITPSGPLTNSGNCHVFMEYTSDVSSGGVSNVQFDYDQHVITFGY